MLHLLSTDVGLVLFKFVNMIGGIVIDATTPIGATDVRSMSHEIGNSAIYMVMAPVSWTSLVKDGVLITI